MTQSKINPGDKYGRLTAVSGPHDNPNGPRRGITWLWRCDCGNQVYQPVAVVLSAHTRSCGCQQSNKERVVDPAWTYTPTYEDIRYVVNHAVRDKFITQDIYYNPAMDEDDLQQDTMITLLYGPRGAAKVPYRERTFKDQAHARAYLFIVARSKMQNATQRYAWRKRYTVMREKERGEGGQQLLPILDARDHLDGISVDIGDDYSTIDAFHSHLAESDSIDIELTMQELPAREYKTYVMLKLGYTWREIAEHFDRHPMSIRQAFDRAVCKLFDSDCAGRAIPSVTKAAILAASGL